MHNLLGLTNPLIDLKVVEAACNNQGLPLTFFMELLRARKESERDGNRRRLFAAFDALLFGEEKATRQDEIVASQKNRSDVHLCRLSFRNWKVFSEAEFSFPAHQSHKPVVLVGGKNGYGKTSLLEGILYCLFGRAAYAERSRLLSDTQSLSGRNANYRHYIERALHVPAKERGDRVTIVKSEWVTAEGPFIVERRWYLDDAGVMSDEDEVLTVWTGEDRDVLPTPETMDSTTFYQAEIERRLMSPGAAAFMLFDGEQVGRFSEKGFGDQVRLVTESAFGLSAWNDAVDDLRDYARDRGRKYEKEEGAYEQKVEEIARLQLQRASMLEEKIRLDGEVDSLRRARDEVLRELSLLQGGTYDSMFELLERRHSNAIELARHYHEFASLASNTLPVILFGNHLKSNLAETLQGDSAADGRHASIFDNEEALAALLERVSTETKSVTKQNQLAGVIASAWNGLRDALPEKVTILKHGYLKASLRASIVARLGRSVANMEGIRSAGARIDQAERENETLARLIADNEKREGDTIITQERLKAISLDLVGLDARANEWHEGLTALEAQIAGAKDSLQLIFGDHTADGSSQNLIEKALAVAAKIENVIAEVRPGCFARIGQAVTKTYSSLAHKQLVSTVEISPDGIVSLFDFSGRDIRGLEASAGENQIFSMALMAAIGDIMPTRVPVIMDTPLGRLDRDHRERLLTFFAHRDVQTIMLSQPDEVNGIYLEMIEDRVATRFLLDHQWSSDGPGATVAREGYFDEAAA